TDPPLESSTTVAPLRSRSRAKFSKSFGVSAVIMPTALTHPPQLGWHATQSNFIGTVRGPGAAPACAEPDKPANTSAARLSTAAAGSLQVPKTEESFKLVPSPNPSPPATSPLAPMIDSDSGVTKLVSGRLPIVQNDLLHRHQEACNSCGKYGTTARNFGSIWKPLERETSHHEAPIAEH